MKSTARSLAYFKRQKADKLLFSEVKQALNHATTPLLQYLDERLKHFSIAATFAPAHLYILEGKTPKVVENVIEWAMYYDKADRIVNKTTIRGVEISTVFLAMNYAFLDDSQPLLFETMVWGGNENQYQRRYATWQEAEAGHQQVCELVIESF